MPGVDHNLLFAVDGGIGDHPFLGSYPKGAVFLGYDHLSVWLDDDFEANELFQRILSGIDDLYALNAQTRIGQKPVSIRLGSVDIQ